MKAKLTEKAPRTESLEWPGDRALLKIGGNFCTACGAGTGVRLQVIRPIPPGGSYEDPSVTREFTKPGEYIIAIPKGTVSFLAWGPTAINWSVELELEPSAHHRPEKPASLEQRVAALEAVAARPASTN